ncbi:MAG: DUF2357 domain-containing protein [Clostridium sp.]|nr:DUF2357 domain-containing protein [Clostridium sp.]
MDIVSNIPFELKLIRRFPQITEEKATYFISNESEIGNVDSVTLAVEENEEIEIYFNAIDSNARLYLEALDIMPLDDSNIMEDQYGRIYRMPSDESFILYKTNAGYDALRVDVFKIAIFCEEQWFYGLFQILPKPISVDEWCMMRDDLEKEIRGLAQDIVRRNMGLGNGKNAKVPPKALYDFLVIKKYSKNVLMALVDIADNPRNEIITMYENRAKNNSGYYKFDSETIKRYAMKSGSEPVYKVPVKTTSFDIQDNRLLKMIITAYENKLNRFIELIKDVEMSSKSPNSGGSVQYKNTWKESLSSFKETAFKLKKMTAILKMKEWYCQVGKLNESYIPHSFILDSRYNILYQMYLELKKDAICIELDPQFSYTWKRSSYMYEMWCYFKVCHFLLTSYEMTTVDWNFMFSEKILFPFLEEKTTVVFEDEKSRIEVIYDSILPRKKEQTNLKNPLFIAEHHSSYRNHNRPDMVVNVYNKESNWYLGTVILECKYRKLHSFWAENSTRSSRGQLEAYYNNARSIYLLNGLGEKLQMHPVTKVIALTPDAQGEGEEQQDFNILVKELKPSHSDNCIDSLGGEILFQIHELENRFEKIRDLPVIM